MSDESDEAKKRIPRRAGAIGYGRPPKEHQFKQGQSGNLKGRPPRPRNPAEPKGALAKMVLKVSAEKVAVAGANGARKMTAVEAVIRGVVVKALKGDPKMLPVYLKMLRAAEDELVETVEKVEAARNTPVQIFAIPDNGRDQRPAEDVDDGGDEGDGEA